MQDAAGTGRCASLAAQTLVSSAAALCSCFLTDNVFIVYAYTGHWPLSSNQYGDASSYKPAVTHSRDLHAASHSTGVCNRKLCGKEQHCSAVQACMQPNAIQGIGACSQHALTCAPIDYDLRAPQQLLGAACSKQCRQHRQSLPALPTLQHHGSYIASLQSVAHSNETQLRQHDASVQMQRASLYLSEHCNRACCIQWS
eukprot:16058-Heterococcus_DN1.PRE.2